MLLAYVDESYRNIEDRYYLSAVVCTPEQTVALTTALDAVMYEFAPAFGMSRRAEIHGYDIWHAHNDWIDTQQDPEARAGVLRDAVTAIVEHSTMVFWRGIDIPAQKARGYPDVWPADQVCFQHVLERINTRAVQDRDYALIIRDEISDPNVPRLDLELYRRAGTQGYRPTALSRIVDTVHFAPSKHSRLLQAADVIAFVACLHQHVNQAHVRAKPVIEELYGLISYTYKSNTSGLWQ